jgi:hypothetical protein
MIIHLGRNRLKNRVHSLHGFRSKEILIEVLNHPLIPTRSEQTEPSSFTSSVIRFVYLRAVSFEWKKAVFSITLVKPLHMRSLTRHYLLALEKVAELPLNRFFLGNPNIRNWAIPKCTKSSLQVSNVPPKRVK